MIYRLTPIVFPLCLLVSILGWWLSYPCPFTACWPFGYREGLAVVDAGSIALVWCYSPGYPSEGYCPSAFVMNDEGGYLGRYCNLDEDSPHFLGFNVAQMHDTRPPWIRHDWWVRIPFWFPTVASALLTLHYFWRRFRCHGPSRAFPVELRCEAVQQKS